MSLGSYVGVVNVLASCIIWRGVYITGGALSWIMPLIHPRTVKLNINIAAYLSTCVGCIEGYLCGGLRHEHRGCLSFNFDFIWRGSSDAHDGDPRADALLYSLHRQIDGQRYLNSPYPHLVVIVHPSDTTHTPLD